MFGELGSSGHGGPEHPVINQQSAISKQSKCHSFFASAKKGQRSTHEEALKPKEVFCVHLSLSLIRDVELGSVWLTGFLCSESGLDFAAD